MISARETCVLLLSIAVGSSLAAVPGAAQQDEGTTAYQAWYRGLREAQPDSARGAEVRDLDLTQDAGTFHLRDGELYLLRAISGRTVGAVWTGEGRFSLEAPTSIEQAQIRRVLGSQAVDLTIRRAVFFFTDNVESVFPSVRWEARTPPSGMRREVEEALKYLSDGDGWLDRDISLPMLNKTPGFFYAHVADGRNDPLMLCRRRSTTRKSPYTGNRTMTSGSS